MFIILRNKTVEKIIKLGHPSVCATQFLGKFKNTNMRYMPQDFFKFGENNLRYTPNHWESVLCVFENTTTWVNFKLSNYTQKFGIESTVRCGDYYVEDTEFTEYETYRYIEGLCL